VAFLQRAAAALKPGGMLFVKENVCERGFIVDSSDASVTRCVCVWGGRGAQRMHP
jgi:protein N-terminal methyltransferase